MITVTEQLPEEMVDSIVREVDPQRIVLFGSYARGEAEIDVVELQGRIAELLMSVNTAVVSVEIGLELVEKETYREVVDPRTGEAVRP